MKDGKKCRCLIVALAVVAAILAISYVWGYSVGDWTVVTWLAAIIIVVAASICIRCRLKEDENS